MSLLKSFMKRNFLWIMLAILMIGIQEFFLFLLNASIHDLLYSTVIEGVLILIIGIIDFLSYRTRVKNLDLISKQAVSQQLNVPEPRDAIEEKYQDILENINIDRELSVGKTARQQQDMQEYYSLWVHQVKTPISAMQLLLQVQKSALENDSDVMLPEGKSEAELSKLLLEQIEDKDYKEMELLGDLEEELFRVEEYVNMALQYQRISSETNDFVLKKCSLDKMIRESIRKYAKVMIRKKIPIHYEGTELKVLTDEKWISFVLGQVLSNAVKYTKEGAVSIGIVQKTNWSYIKVSDCGIGIRKEDLPRVFEKGYTGYNGHSDKRSTGIGLYLCKQVLTKLGHTIRMESEIGKGTTVWIGFSTKKMDTKD